MIAEPIKTVARRAVEKAFFNMRAHDALCMLNDWWEIADEPPLLMEEFLESVEKGDPDVGYPCK